MNVSELDKLFAHVTSKPYKYNKPSIEDAPWGDRCFTVTDPFSNRILFNEAADT
ncbi:hypothetical protein GCM10007984_06010 [Shewanella putrefaciens]|nr:conserved hypothetical protein [Shewanella sp. W3-18-1]AVV85527.1 hypothetical protein SPWS13_3849 [Shewanella putrefaciens]GGN10996.1 hypothetical protein GCM10007984_06010 [Shewanella putrefaciens]